MYFFEPNESNERVFECVFFVHKRISRWNEMWWTSRGLVSSERYADVQKSRDDSL